MMAFQPPESPQKCDERLKPQLGDFIARSSEGFEGEFMNLSFD